MRGGQFFCQTTPGWGGSETVLAVDTSAVHDDQWSELMDVNRTLPCKRFSYKSPRDSYGNVAEIEWSGYCTSTTTSTTTTTTTTTTTDGVYIPGLDPGMQTLRGSFSGNEKLPANATNGSLLLSSLYIDAKREGIARALSAVSASVPFGYGPYNVTNSDVKILLLSFSSGASLLRSLEDHFHGAGGEGSLAPRAMEMIL